jgi:hypothetical protein
MPDPFASYLPGITAPAEGGVAVTPSDSTNLTDTSRAIYVGGAGSVVAVMKNGQVVSFAGMQAGVVYPLRVNRINATGTTATGIVALY